MSNSQNWKKNKTIKLACTYRFKTNNIITNVTCFSNVTLLTNKQTDVVRVNVTINRKCAVKYRDIEKTNSGRHKLSL